MARRFDFDNFDADERDFLAQAWSDAHTIDHPFNANWDQDRKDFYYLAFVDQWDVANEDRDFDPTYDYLIVFEEYDPSYFDKDPYKND